MEYLTKLKTLYLSIEEFLKKNKKLKKLSRPYNEPNKTYKKLVCLQGFGHSGSGAVLDFLSEFNNTTVFGFHDKNGGAIKLNNEYGSECDFLRSHGGIFDLMSAFLVNQNNLRIVDCKLKDFITLSEFYYRKIGGIYNDKYMELTNEFIEKILDFKNETSTGMNGNMAFRFNNAVRQKDYANLRTPYEFNNFKKRYRYFLKKIPVEQFLSYSKDYVTSFLRTFESNDFLVLDQFLSDYCANFDLYKSVVGDYKLIAVYRDPRDVYATGRLLNEDWIDKDPEVFVKWYKYLLSPYINQNNENFLLIRFEDFIINHERIKKHLCEFLNIDLSHHTYPGSYLQLKKSIKNIGIYKKLSGFEKELSYIESNLKDFCYKLPE